jgi:hypothetical protein
MSEKKDVEEVKKELHEELLRLAVQPVVHNRMCKMEEIHKRLNAIDRVQGEAK